MLHPLRSHGFRLLAPLVAVIAVSACGRAHADNASLAERYPEDKLKEILLPQSQWHPFPRAGEREAWMQLPDDMRVFVCHDYQPNGRALAFESTVAQQREDNIHVGSAISVDEFVALREARDATLAMPSLILPSLQVNMRAGYLPPPNGQGRMFLKVPINAFGGAHLDRLPANK